MATHSSLLAWEIAWTRSLAGYSHKRVGHDLVPKQQEAMCDCLNVNLIKLKVQFLS